MTIQRVYELVELAGTYLEDGALRTAAKKLHDAADILTEIANREDRERASMRSKQGEE